MMMRKQAEKKVLDPLAKSRRRAIIMLAVLSVLMLPVCAVYGFYTSKLQLLSRADEYVSDYEVSYTDTEDELAELSDEISQLKESQVVVAKGEVSADEGVINILLIGTDDRTAKFSRNARGDSCILLSINKKTMEVHLVSFERGMGVPILEGKNKGKYDWLTHTFRYGGAELMTREIRECFKIDVDRYVRVNFTTFVELINAVGGVDVYLSEIEASGLNGEVKTNAKTVHTVYPGLNHLDGFDALQYSRIRYIDSDWGRIERQRKVIEAVIEQTKSLSILELNDMLDTVLPLVQTNLTEADITELIMLLPRYRQVTVSQMTIPQKGTYGSMKGLGNRSMFAVDFEQNAQILQNALYGEE